MSYIVLLAIGGICYIPLIYLNWFHRGEVHTRYWVLAEALAGIAAVCIIAGVLKGELHVT